MATEVFALRDEGKGEGAEARVSLSSAVAAAAVIGLGGVAHEIRGRCFKLKALAGE